MASFDFSTTASDRLWLDRLLVTLALAATAFLLANLLQFGYGRDQGVYAVIADGILHGRLPYRDAWDVKPPGVFFLYALVRAFVGTGQQAIRVVEAAGLVSLLYAFALFSRRYVGDWRAGVLGGTIAILTHVESEYWHTAQPENFAAIALAWALVCDTYEPGTGDGGATWKQWAAWAGAGFLYGVAALMKPPLGAGIVVGLGFAVASRRRHRHRWHDSIAPVVAYVCGALVPLAATVGYFVAGGAWPDLYQTLFDIVPRYTALTFQRALIGDYLQSAFLGWFMGFSTLNAAGMLLWLLFPPIPVRREVEGVVRVLGVVVFQLIGIALQAKFFLYHFGGALPFGGLLAGWGFWKLWCRARGNLLGIVVFGLAVYVCTTTETATPNDLQSRGTFWSRCTLRAAAWTDSSRRASIEDQLGSEHAAALRQVARYLIEQTPPGAPVFVWGYESTLYDVSGHYPPTRFIYNMLQRLAWSRDSSREQLMRDLQQTPPAAIIVEHGDRLPWVTGESLDSAESLASFGELNAWLQQHYRLETTIEPFDIHVRD